MVGRLRARADPGKTEDYPNFQKEETHSVLLKSLQGKLSLTYRVRERGQRTKLPKS